MDSNSLQKSDQSFMAELARNLVAGLAVSFVAISLGAAFGILSERGAFAGILSAGVIALITWRLWLKADELAANGDASVYLGIPLAPFAYFMSVAAGGTIVILLLLAIHHARSPDRPRAAG